MAQKNRTHAESEAAIEAATEAIEAAVARLADFNLNRTRALELLGAAVSVLQDLE